MLKLMSLIDRRSDLSLDAFSEHWRTVHRELALRLVAPGIMRGYVQNHRRATALEGLEPAGDGCPELWVDSVDAVAQLGACREYLEGAHLDEPNFMASNARLMISRPAVLVHTLGRSEATAVTKLLLFFELPPADPAEPWASLASFEHPLLLPDARPLRLEREIAIHDLPSGLPAPAFDVIESSWWPDPGTLERAWKHRSKAPLITGVGMKRMAGMLAWELPVLWPAIDAASQGGAHRNHPSN